MKSLLRRRPSPALIIAVIALFISLSGVSYGVATGFIDSREILNNQVRSVDIRNNEIRTRDLRNNEVRGIDIRNSTIQSRDIAINAVRGEDVKEDTLAKVPSALLADSATSAAARTARTPSSEDAAHRRGRGRRPRRAGDPRAAEARGLRAPPRCDGEPHGSTLESTADRPTRERPGARTVASATRPDFDPATTPITVRGAGAAVEHRGLHATAVAAVAPSGKGFSGEHRDRPERPPTSAASSAAGALRARPRRRPAGSSGAA